MNAKKLEGVWYESTEESEGDRVVYRTAQYEFPRTRAPRPSLEFGRDGKVFLEINPAGQWLFIEQATGQPIAAALARLLVDNDRTN